MTQIKVYKYNTVEDVENKINLFIKMMNQEHKKYETIHVTIEPVYTREPFFLGVVIYDV